ncbi:MULTISPECIES: aromatic ring-hydroxylating oxygenase subunit alpha [unclassified Halomonas]|uniref:aromatic ring-hydroxylating oxygenase subunit alpha n=1 Tax=unclassified Halomonas TaxID=2609666 RepID=UPI0021E46F43|nr:MULTISPECIES: aromatic ring-hydroxylating dioxygenase subunit alpha [unclassified Halomonas]UYF99830.1 aromatic ring-hydroxylating dioxygenase subunit alpha [Halomonas sp. GD1P12]WNL39077.1 aromatic ring-hydroxylating dioxygenase subunit alpha [Halomonas sp. PAMB 3232]WNL42426.1 aromatic ring-hydroxylating dioxygenase subunit alpha [Halomonas sp. PAMB 3264]
MNNSSDYTQNDPLAAMREETVEMLESRARTYSLPQPFYNDARLFALDMEEIFEKEWLFAGMSCEIPAKGNFMTLEIGNNPIVIVRGGEGQIHAFHNVCRHRGSRLCTTDKGKVAKLVCPYHQWTYELDGRLLFAGSDMGTNFDLNQFGLKPVHVRTAGGFVFINLSENPSSIDDFLVTLEHYLEPYQMDNVKVAVESSIVEQANWKLVIENNRECYHCNGSHPELLNSLMEFDDTEDPRATDKYKDLVARKQNDWNGEQVPWQLKRFGSRNRITRTPLLDGVVSMTMDGKPACNKLMGRLTSPDMGSLRILHLPNSWNHFMGDHSIVFRVLPLGPQQTMVTTKWLVHKDAVEGVDYDPENMRRVWDATNDQDRKLAEENQRGINSKAYQPGPYSETYEFGVIDFVNWYADRLLENLGSEGASLTLAKAQG